MFRNTYVIAPLLSLTVLMAGGCGRKGQELGFVTGTVTLNGSPVPFAFVQFQPIDPPGTYGSAYADPKGHYELQFTKSSKGAPLGKHEVTIRTPKKDEIQIEDEATGKMVLPDLPPGFVEKLEKRFAATVEPGSNSIDFELSNPGLK
jgi:hypothetical protein